MGYLYSFLLLILFFWGISSVSAQMLVNYVDTKIGANSYRQSNCVIGPQLPFGSISPSPQTLKGNTSGFDPKSRIIGFGQLHVSGTGGSSKYGHFLLSPQIGVTFSADSCSSDFINKITKPYIYSVFLKKYGINVDISPSFHSAIYRFTYPKSNDASILLDATRVIPRDMMNSKGIIYENSCTIDKKNRKIRAHIKYGGGWGGKEPYNLYFVAELNRKPATMFLWKNFEFVSGEDSVSLNGDTYERIGSVCTFDTHENNELLLKVSISFASFEKAEEYLYSEIPDWEFEDVKQGAAEVWEKQLRKIRISSSEQDKKIFYTSLYHTMIMPRNRIADYSDNYTTFWDDHYAVWDTWRTLYPLHLLINEDMVRGTIKSFIERFKHNGKVQDAFIAGIDMPSEQGGNNIGNIIVDAYAKGLGGIDWNEAYRIVKYYADKERKGFMGWTAYDYPQYDNNDYLSNGYIGTDSHEFNKMYSCSSYTLEYAYNDYLAAMIAKGLGREDDYQLYLKRSSSWMNLWDINLKDGNYSGFIGIKLKNGNFIDFDVRKKWGSWWYPFYEGNSWSYSYFVPHDLNKLIGLMGGKDKFVERLEYALSQNLIDYGNEPSFLTIRMFNHAGRPDLASKWIDKVMKTKFGFFGCTGNEDSGAMSSWYIWSAIGLFPNAGQDYYYINTPLYESSELLLSNGKKINIGVTNFSQNRRYIKSCKINGREWNSSFIPHTMISEGAEISIEVSEKPTEWGVKDVYAY